MGGRERSPHLSDCGGTASPKKWQRDRDSGSRRSTLSSRCEGRWEQLLPEKGAWEGPVEGAKPAGGPALTSTHVKPNPGPRSRKRRERKLKMKGAFRDPPPGPPCGTDLCVMAARSPPATPRGHRRPEFHADRDLVFLQCFHTGVHTQSQRCPCRPPLSPRPVAPARQQACVALSPDAVG